MLVGKRHETEKQEDIMATLTSKPLDWFSLDPKQPRKHFSEPELRELGESMKARGQWQPVVASPDGTLRMGERRLRAARLVGLKELQVIISEKELNESEIRLIQLTENMQREDLTGYEMWTACSELMCMNPGWQIKDLAENLKRDPSTMTRILSPSRCTAAWQDALKERKVGISHCYAASKLPEKEQAALLALTLSGASRDAIEQAGRKSRKADVPAVRMSRVRCMLPSGVCIVASGEKLSLDDLIESFAEAHKEAKKAREQGLDAKTFQAVMKDKSRKG